MEQEIRDLWEQPAVRVGVILVSSIVGAWLVEIVIRRTLVVLARKTKTDLDDVVVAAIRRPVFLSVLMLGLGYATDELPVSAGVIEKVHAVLMTFVAVIWAGAGFRIAVAILESLSRRASTTSIVQPRTLPVFEMLLKLAVVSFAVYFIFLAWHIDLTAWLASAGIIGIAVGFAAKDTLANLFSGIFIVADAPYKVGDFIVLDDGLRGRVVKIGIRSTRLLTADDVEITVPNAVIGASKIVNETGGPSVRQRIRIRVDVAYGSDITVVRDVLLRCPKGIAEVAVEPVPQVRFREFGGSGLGFELHVWLENPAAREQLIDALNCAVYEAFAASGIEIPYSKHDVYIKELPVTSRSSPGAHSNQGGLP